MPEILVISGKGGTGKTSVTAAFCHLADNAIICDLDVDAPDLHLLLSPKRFRQEDFYSGNEALILPERCTRCGTCVELCRYGAVQQGEAFVIDPYRCEGCKVCVTFCPEEAISFPEKHCGEWYLSNTRFGPMAHAQLFPAEENSGRLVALLKKEAKSLAEQRGAHLILSDGPPGIGCPVISALSGADLAVIVTEPTPSGRHDLERILALCAHFNIPAAVIVNKCDLNAAHTRAISDLCEQRRLPVVARLPHDVAMTEAMVAAKAVTEFCTCDLTKQLRQAWAEIQVLAGLEAVTVQEP